ncbi:reverse transcriptase [Gossypium australe]|uniref:Reverse transcriptase n=1 Tax=Gossypium australe TaxID=47621 RepID=A0A5B6X1E6_9ROSI|nr:reverse transcriptase [Gossypium australe]
MRLSSLLRWVLLVLASRVTVCRLKDDGMDGLCFLARMAAAPGFGGLDFGYLWLVVLLWSAGCGHRWMMRRGRNGEGEPSLEIGKGKAKVDEEASDSGSITDRRLQRVPKEGRSRVRSNKTKARSREVEHVRLKYNMDGCFVVEAEGRCGGLALLWKNEANITINNFSNHHINSLVSIDGMDCFRFIDWIVGGDSNAILNDAKNFGGRCKSRVVMEEFGKVLDELALIDIKPNKGWFTWSSIRDGSSFVKETLDRFVVLASGVEKMSFLSTYVVRRSCLDHDAILLDLIGLKLTNDFKDPRLFFKYEACCAKDKDAKNLVRKVYEGNSNSHFIKCFEKIRSILGSWQHSQFNRLRSRMHRLNERIDRLVDGPNVISNTEMLRTCPGIDGLSSLFFHENWDVVGKDVIRITFKIISKVLANRLKLVLHSCISHNQSAFVLGRMIHDNILIAHDLVLYLQSSKNVPNKGLVIQLNMSKAFDR